MATLTTSWKTYASSSFSTGPATIAFYLEAKYSSQNIAGNTTTIQTRLRSAYTKGGSTAGAGYNFTCSYASTVSGSGTWTFQNEVITSGSATITHNSNGTKSISLSASAYNKYWNFTRNMSATVSLPTIPRAATVTTAPNFNDEATLVSVSFKNPAGFQLRPYMNFYINSKLVLSITRPKASISSPYVWAITEAEQKQMRTALINTNSCQVNIGFDTFSGNTQIGFNSLARTFSIVNANPVFEDFQFEDINTVTTALTGNNQKIIKGYSKIQAIISTANKAIGQKEATITKYRMTIGTASVDITYNEEANVSGIISNAETGTINIYAIDSRGNSTLVTKLAATEIEYEPIYVNINSSSFQRDDNRVGDNGILTLNGTFWNNSFGTTTNNIAISYRLKKSDSNTWINGTTVIVPTATENNFTFTGMIASDNPDTSWDLESSYDLEITATDELSTSITTYILASAIPTLSIDKDGVGIMCAYNNGIGGGLQVYGQPVTAPANEMIKDYTAESNTNTIEFDDLNILPNENYKFRIVGCAASSNADIWMTFNDITSTSYYSAGRYDNGTGTTSDTTLTQNAGYRPTKARFYYSLHLSTRLTVIDGLISIKPNINQNVNTPYVEWQTKIVWNGHQNVSNVVGVMAGDINKITKIKFANATFKKGTRIQIIKVNGDFTI